MPRAPGTLSGFGTGVVSCTGTDARLVARSFGTRPPTAVPAANDNVAAVPAIVDRTTFIIGAPSKLAQYSAANRCRHDRSLTDRRVASVGGPGVRQVGCCLPVRARTTDCWPPKYYRRRPPFFA